MLDETGLSVRVTEIVQAHQGVEGALLPILHAVQAEFGHVPQAALPVIAQGVGVTRAELHGVISFYHDFRDAPAGQQVVRLCRAEACQAMGGDAVAAEVQAQLGLGWHETGADGAVTLEPVFCLGLCACAPAAQVNGRLIGRVDAAKVAAHLAKVGA
ncbi:MAG: formate dehydrogenase subunit gamma [Pseudotabrizicola sp.]|uniref:formate dehydrogenase subunit gamma n=1 Tax=Pseudotabrizicola sp. TaxID=2939647 RepID=UPI002720B832|nr:formate dehydrogenase subunit gamma [Pseudotabrizicola sp.]MDO8882136.1 formate dehydrogenase subunit gamma [Pseudotabrizicola sp.]MDP2079912.1 formate dehydrogenase subunit gamma [Pseudotabrizicola sp.]MDZ7575651.1 formate dehydrogenase subunit gamma [Pseudotabrizicola sp.]